MKYNELAAYRAYLEQSFSKKTALTYYNAVSWLLSDQFILHCKDLDIDMVIAKLQKMKHKNAFSKHKNAFFKFCDFLDLRLSREVALQIENMNDDKKKKYRKLKAVSLDDITNQVKNMKDKKLKLSFTAMLAKGLRVSELAGIKKEDCFVNPHYIDFYFIGKGGSRESVRVLKDDNPRLFASLSDLIEKTKDGERVFYSASYLQAKAYEYKFQCHDLRRAFAKMEYQKLGSIAKVQELLRHAKTQNTKIYLSSKVQV